MTTDNASHVLDLSACDFASNVGPFRYAVLYSVPVSLTSTVGRRERLHKRGKHHMRTRRQRGNLVAFIIFDDIPGTL